ncbi:MAG: DUF434 domain-containing protein [Bacteroidota bacterium]
MPNKQRHRGAQPKDGQFFGGKWIPILNMAVEDMSWLMTRGYPRKSSLNLVGNRYRLNTRQRHAVWRASCADQDKDARNSKRIDVAELNQSPLVVDGYNLLITVEAALAGGVILFCRDGAVRDIASIHGTYRKVEETLPALDIIGNTLASISNQDIHWFLDKPVSNSGRLKTLMGEVAREKSFRWNIDLVNNPDKAIVEEKEKVAISSDGWVLDEVDSWTNIHRYIVNKLPEVNKLELLGKSIF